MGGIHRGVNTDISQEGEKSFQSRMDGGNTVLWYLDQ
jgi:hypothetical protein